MSLHTPVGDDSGSELADLLHDATALDAYELAVAGQLSEDVRRALGTLSEREAEIVTLRFGLRDGNARTYDDIAKAHGVSRERIRQIEKKAMGKLRHVSRAEMLREYAS